MNVRTSYTLIAILAVVSTISISSVYSFEQTNPGSEVDGKMLAQTILLGDVPVSVWTDSSVYDHESSIHVEGTVANIRSGTPVTLTVISPSNNIVTIDQLSVSTDGMYSTVLSTAGKLWKYDGTYTIRVQYGSQEVNNKVLVELTGGILLQTPTPTPTVRCSSSELTASNTCVPFTISGAIVTGGLFNADKKSLTVNISGTDEGTLMVNPSTDAINGIFMVLVNDEQWDDVEIDGNKVTIMFPPGTETVEIIGTFAIPEFGTIVAMIFVVAITSIIAISAKSRLSLIPKF